MGRRRMAGSCAQQQPGCSCDSRPRTHPLSSLAAAVLLSLSLFATSARADGGSSDTMTTAAAATPAPTITTAPVYLPHYNNESWKPVRGSILGIDSTANETTYTIFCPSATQPTCDLNVEIPFIIVNGPGTVHWSGSITSQFTAYLGCDLVGTTEATCSGYSSYGPRFPPGPPSQSTKINWTSTLSGSAVQWGTLTLVDLPATATDDGSSSSGSPTAQTSNEFYYTPEPTNAGTRPTLSLWSVSAASLGSLLLAAGFVSV